MIYLDNDANRLAIEMRHITKRFGSIVANDDVNLELRRGEILSLLGENGSGKTTLMNMLGGIYYPDEDQILIDGEAPGPKSKALVSYLPDKEYLPDWMTPKQLMDFFADFYADFDRGRAEEMLARLGLDPAQKVKQMSKGTREKVQLILVMSRRAKLYLLDEPIGGVDPATRDYILDTIIRNYNPEAAVVISTHLIADVEQVLDDVIFIQNGQILLQSDVDSIREEKGMSVDQYFREVFKC